MRARDRLRAPLPMGKTGGEMLSRLQLGKHALIVFYRPLEQAGYEVVLELEYASKAVLADAIQGRQSMRSE